MTEGLSKATVTVPATGKVFSFKPLGDVRPVVDAGGLFNYARKPGKSIPQVIRTTRFFEAISSS